MHNGPLASWQAFWATRIALYGAMGITIGGACAAGGTVAYAGFQAIGTASTVGGALIDTGQAMSSALQAMAACLC